ncbi:hypothetical protein V6N12_030916 [Hibiscus sabdariffa]|uniref:Uncharacterized protein n=1 Tax=Hibiscus sabdariffa TaxID=183260 RepID=A0ABR2E8X2_9ROSI
MFSTFLTKLSYTKDIPGPALTPELEDVKDDRQHDLACAAPTPELEDVRDDGQHDLTGILPIQVEEEVGDGEQHDHTGIEIHVYMKSSFFAFLTKFSCTRYNPVTPSAQSIPPALEQDLQVLRQ